MHRFRDCEVDPARREVRRGGEAMHLEPQAFDLLVHLIEHRDRVVTKVELLDGVWGHRFVSEANLTTRVKEARRAVGDDGTTQHTIRNVRGRGYRFVADLMKHDVLVGRDADLAALRSALAAQRLVTLVGPGGVGKTSLARAVLDGGHFVDLSLLRPGSDVLPAVAHALSISLDAARPETAVAAIARLDTLVALDNCEHVVDGAAELVDRLGDVGDRAVRVLATSRVRLGTGGEWVHEVAPLDAASALTLFDQRARAATRQWNLDAIDQSQLDAVLAGLDRLPLTIEMAAARLGAMTFDDVAGALLSGAPVLQVSHRSSGHRHRSLDSLVRWSIGLLPDGQRQVFEDCCVFAGAVTAADAAAVLATASSTSVRLADLAERSLLTVDVAGATARYGMLQTVRAAASVGFEASGRSKATRARHAGHFAEVVAAADVAVRGIDEHAGRRRIDAIVPEIREAHRWMREHDPPLADAVCASLHLFTYSSLWNEPVEWARSLLGAGGSVSWAGAHVLLAGAAANRGDLAVAATHARAALDVGDARALAGAWEVLADVAIYGGDFAATMEATTAIRALAAELGDPHLDAIAVVDDAVAEAYLGDPERAIALVDAFDASRCATSDRGWLIYARGEALSALERPEAVVAFVEALDLANGAGNHFVASVAQMSLAAELARAGERDRALDAYADCLRGYLRHGNLTHALTALRNVVEPLFERDPETAISLAAATSGDAGRVSYGAEAARLPAVLERFRSAVGEERFEQWWATGVGLDLTDAVRLAASAI